MLQSDAPAAGAVDRPPILKQGHIVLPPASGTGNRHRLRLCFISFAAPKYLKPSIEDFTRQPAQNDRDLELNPETDKTDTLSEEDFYKSKNQ
jgi:hypothetical protein